MSISIQYPLDLVLPLGSAPSWTFTASDDSVDPPARIDLSGASIWFAIKAAPTDTDATALIFASTANGKVVITDAEEGEFQVDLLEADTVATATLVANASYSTFIKIQLASGETRVKSGRTTIVYEGVQAP